MTACAAPYGATCAHWLSQPDNLVTPSKFQIAITIQLSRN